VGSTERKFKRQTRASDEFAWEAVFGPVGRQYQDHGKPKASLQQNKGGGGGGVQYKKKKWKKSL